MLYRRYAVSQTCFCEMLIRCLPSYDGKRINTGYSDHRDRHKVHYLLIKFVIVYHIQHYLRLGFFLGGGGANISVFVF